jgi:hypothetical protein
MLWVFSVIGLTGIFCGFFFRAPAMVVLSFACFIAALATSLASGSPAGGAIAMAIGSCAALQIGYLLGLGARYGLRPMQRLIKSAARNLEIGGNPLTGFARSRLRFTGPRQKLRNFAGHRSL